MFGLSSTAPPALFFDDKMRAFWTLHILGWGAWLCLRAVSGMANGQPWTFLLLQVISTLSGFSLTLLLAVCYRLLIDRRPFFVWGTSFMLSSFAVALWASIDAFAALFQNPDATFTPRLLIGAVYVNAPTIAAWTALYYAINYFVKLEEQQDRMLRLEAQAMAAQLAALRYQLNPHFLFNTLNSISTLVLLKQTDRANVMLSRLAVFLRDTLTNEPTTQVTLTQEIETLKLYLAIEAMRFEERLRTHFDIEPAVAYARLPALLLQPLIENAIKYAVSPQEKGADINVIAKRAGKNLRIIVSDTGPGIAPGITPGIGLGDIVRVAPIVSSAPPPPQSQAVEFSTGVGLVNIRDRLAQAYGDKHQLDISATPERGFRVTITLPLHVG